MSLQIRTQVGNDYKYIDLYRDEPVNLSLSFAELQDITKKNSAYSKAFSVPGSKNNNELFNFFYDLNAIPTTFNPNNTFKAVLMWSGYEILSGHIRLNQVNIDRGEIVYQITFYNQIGDLAANIGDKFLYDLDLNYLSHPYSINTILESQLDPDLFSLTGSTDYAYQNGKTFWGLFNQGYNYISGNTIDSSTTPLLQFSPTSTGFTYTPLQGFFDYPQTPAHDFYFKPAIQIRELYSAVVNQAGYSINSAFFDTSYFKKFYMPLKFVDESIYSRNAIPACFTYTNETLGTLSTGSPVYTQPTNNLVCNSLGFSAYTNGFTISSAYTGTYTFRFTYDVNPTSDCFDVNYPEYMFYFDNTIIPDELIYDGGSCFAPNQVSVDRQFNITGTSFISFYFIGNQVEINKFRFEIVNPPRFIPDGANINYDIEFPPNDYKQIDFITSINKYFNLVVVPDPDKPQNLIIEPIVDYVGKGRILDWTTKVDIKQSQSLYPTTSLLNGTLEYEFKLDQDYANQDFNTQTNRIFGTDKFQLGLEYKDTTTKFDYIFSSPIDITINNAYTDLLTIPAMSKLKQVDVDGVTQQTFVPFKILPKLIFRGITLPNDNYGLVNQTGLSTGDTTCSSGVTINVTQAGYIKYNDCVGNTSYEYVGTGIRTVASGSCIRNTSVAAGVPLSQIANFTINSTGTTCTIVVNQNTFQQWYINSFSNDRYANLNRFTTYPFSYTGFSHYINFRGEDQSNVNPTELIFDSEDLYNIYYQPYINDIINEENKIYSCKIYLLPQDISALRWDEKILINNTYFRINKISNFNATEPSICDIELVKLTREYPEHRRLYYDLVPCGSGDTLHSNSDLMYNLYAYAGNYVTLYDDNLTYKGCYNVQIATYNPLDIYEHFYLSSGYTPNLVAVYPDCGCSGRTAFNIVQQEPGIPTYFWYQGDDCSTSATTIFRSSSDNLDVTGGTIYKIYNTGTTEYSCVNNISKTFTYPTDWFSYSAYSNCNDCNFIPPTQTPTPTPTSVTPTPTPTIPETPTMTPSPSSTPPSVVCYYYQNEYFGGDWYGNYTSCDGQQYFNVFLNPGQSVCAVQGSVVTIYGNPLTQLFPCNL